MGLPDSECEICGAVHKGYRGTSANGRKLQSVPRRSGFGTTGMPRKRCGADPHAETGAGGLNRKA